MVLMYACVGVESLSVARLAKAGAGSEAVSKSAQTHTELAFPRAQDVSSRFY